MAQDRRVDTGPGRSLTRSPGDPQRTELLELFFDLVLIASLTLVSQYMAARPTWAGIGQGLLLLSTLWAVWVTTTSVTDIYQPRQRPVQLLVLGTMLGAMVMSAAIPEAFGTHGLAFGVPWVVVNLGRALLFVPSLRGRPEQERAVRVLMWNLVAAPFWVVGGLVSDPGTRGVLWLAGLAVDYFGFGFRFPIPGRRPLPQPQTAPKHLADRYQQIYVLTLGELVLVTVLSLSEQSFSPYRLGAFGTAFLTAVLLWASYARGAGSTLGSAIERLPHSGRLVQTNPYAHWLMVVGVVGTAAGSARVIAHPTDRPQAVMVALVAGGLVLFLAGRATLEHQVFGRVRRSHLVGIVLAIGLSPVAPHLPALAASLAVVVLLAGVVAAGPVRVGHRAEQG